MATMVAAVERKDGSVLVQRPVLRAVLQFAVTGAIAVLLLGLLGAYVIVDRATKEAVNTARTLTERAGRGIVEPVLEPGVASGDPAALRRLDRLVRARVLGDGVVRVKLWSPQGRIVYSDDPRLIGQRYALGADEHTVFRTGQVEAEETDLSRPENRFEPDRRLLEVYFPVHTRDGRPLLFEQYVLYSAVAEQRRDLLRRFLPPLVAGLVLLWIVQLPLAASLARRLRREQEERERILVQAADASQAERRRIAADLHDGVVQDLAGVSWALEAAAQRAPAEDAALRTTLRDAAARTRESMRSLRSLLVEIYPPRLREAGLEAALADVVAPAAARGVETHVDVQPGLAVSHEAESLLFRTAQEAVRNALAHAEAHRLDVQVTTDNGRVVLLVADDGRGFDQSTTDAVRRSGHLGLSLLADLARSTGGQMSVVSEPGHGTRVRLEVPSA